MESQKGKTRKREKQKQWTIYYAPDTIGWKIRNLLFGQRAYHRADCDAVNNGPGVMELVNRETNSALVIFADQVDRMKINFGYEEIRQDALAEFEKFKRDRERKLAESLSEKKEQFDMVHQQEYDGREVG